MAKKKKADDVQPLELERVMESVRHDFVDDELISFGYQLGQKYRAIRKVQADKKATAADFTAREKVIEAEIDEISGKINAGFEMRDKPCYVFWDWTAGRVYWFLVDHVDGLMGTVHLDGDELLVYLLADETIAPVKDRAILDHERQMHLPGQDEPIEDAATAEGDEDGATESPDEVETS